MPDEEVTVHVPEQFASGGKDAKGRPVLKPIAREETKVQPVAVVGIVGAAVLVTLGLAFLLGRMVPEQAAGDRGVGLAIISAPLAVAAYTFLRDDELEPYRGRSLWIRARLCGLVYAALWGAFIGRCPPMAY